MTTPALGDSSDKTLQLSKGTRVQGATVEEWIELIAKAPDRTLPAGVAGALVLHFQSLLLDSNNAALVRMARDLDTRELEAFTAWIGSRYPMEAGRSSLTVAREVIERADRMLAEVSTQDRERLERIAGKVTVDLLEGENATATEAGRAARAGRLGDSTKPASLY